MRLDRLSWCCLTVFGALGLIFCTFYFFIGFHESDHCQDLGSIQAVHDINIISMTLDGDIEHSPTYYADCYVKGMRWMFRSFFGMIFSVFIFTLGLVNLYREGG